MNQSNLKNMVILKNLPSNLVEEAIVILKNNKKINKLEKIEKTKSTEKISGDKKENEYIIKEAEMLISNYISDLEEKKEQKKSNNQKVKKKYKKLKIYAYICSFLIIIESIFLIIKWWIKHVFLTYSLQRN